MLKRDRGGGLRKRWPGLAKAVLFRLKAGRTRRMVVAKGPGFQRGPAILGTLKGIAGS
jgi:hypothetical protein